MHASVSAGVNGSGAWGVVLKVSEQQSIIIVTPPIPTIGSHLHCLRLVSLFETSVKGSV